MNNKKSKKKPNTTSQGGFAIMTPEDVDAAGTETDTTVGPGDEGSVEDETVKDAVTEEPKTSILPDLLGTVTDNVDPETIQLYRLIDEYLANIAKGGGIGRTEENLINFIRIGKYLASKNRIDLIEVFFNVLIRGDKSKLMAPDLVFQFIHKINDNDKIKIETLYTALMALNEHLLAPKKRGFALDLKTIEASFGSDSLTAFMKGYL